MEEKESAHSSLGREESLRRAILRRGFSRAIFMDEPFTPPERLFRHTFDTAEETPERRKVERRARFSGKESPDQPSPGSRKSGAKREWQLPLFLSRAGRERGDVSSPQRIEMKKRDEGGKREMRGEAVFFPLAMLSD